MLSNITKFQKCYHVHPVNTMQNVYQSTLARRMFCYYYDWKTITNSQTRCCARIVNLFLFETICTRPALQADEWGWSLPIDLFTFPRCANPHIHGFPRDFQRSYSKPQKPI